MLRAHAVVDHPVFGRILAYEVDGYGGRFLADDANVPSLMSLPYLGAMGEADRADAELYQNTRRFLLTPGAHAYFARGSAAEGMASPHTGQDMIWPMGIIMRGIAAGILRGGHSKNCSCYQITSCSRTFHMGYKPICLRSGVCTRPA